MEGIVSPKELAVVNTSEGQAIRIYYELAVLRKLKKELRCKNIWIKHSLKYSDPEKDFPPDFYSRKDYYCNLLDLSMEWTKCSSYGPYQNSIVHRNKSWRTD